MEVSQPGGRLSLRSSTWVFQSVGFNTCCFFQSCASAKESTRFEREQLI